MALPKNVTGYRFLDKDPSIDLFRDAMRRSKMTYKDIALASGVSESTLRAWDLGNVKKPQHLTLRFAMSAMGFREIFVNKEGDVLEARYTKEAQRADNVVVFRKGAA